jgi:hypothetical protein
MYFLSFIGMCKQGPPELRHVVIKRSASLPSDASTHAMYLGSVLGHLRQVCSLLSRLSLTLILPLSTNILH